MESIVRSTQKQAVCHRTCSGTLRSWRSRHTSQATVRRGLQNNDRIQRRFNSNIAKPGEQARPLEGFYAELLSRPISQTAPATRTAPTPPPQESLPKTDNEELLQKARVVFGSRLAGPGERKADIAAQSRNIAGVLVPPKPVEPDNCCMSGCVNCVWDMYRDEMEEWAAKSAEARAVLQAQRQKGIGTGNMLAAEGTPQHVATNMDDDGGGSETNWSSGVGQGGLFDDIPVGIREFMKTEKMLKERHNEAHTAA